MIRTCICVLVRRVVDYMNKLFRQIVHFIFRCKYRPEEVNNILHFILKSTCTSTVEAVVLVGVASVAVVIACTRVAGFAEGTEVGTSKD